MGVLSLMCMVCAACVHDYGVDGSGGMVYLYAGSCWVVIAAVVAVVDA